MKKEDIKFECKHKKIKYSQCIISPLDSKLKKYLKYFEYFLYFAPNISHKKVKVNEAKWESIYNKFVEIDCSLSKYNKVYARKVKNRDYYSEAGIDGNEFCFECQMMVISRNNNENSLGALLRHIRNALAHGNLYYKVIKKQDVFFLEDNVNNDKTGRILLFGNLLKKLKKFVEEEIK